MAKILFATTAEGVKFYPVTITDAVVHIDGNTQTKLSDLLSDMQDDIDAIDYSGKADKVSGAVSGNFAGLDANGNLVDSGSKAADFDAAGAAATAQAAAEATAAADATSKVNAAKSELIGDNEDVAADNTIYGAKAYADAAVQTALTGLAGALKYKGTVNANADLPANAETGDTYAVATAGTYAGKACEVGDYLVYNGSGWDAINGENQVSNDNIELTIGSNVQVATVDGTAIYVKQVEDMTKIEAVAVADTTEYADVTALFTAPAGE